MKRWVANLAADLTSNGLTVIYDDESHPPGESNTAFMRESCQKADWILCVATPEYRKRCLEKGRGLEFEAEWIEKRGRVIGKNRVVALLRKGQASTSLPPFKDGDNPLDFRTAKKYDTSLQKLLKWMGYAKGPTSFGQVVSRSGLVLLCDINGFSRLRKEQQVRIMNLLWQELGAVAAKVGKKWDHFFPLLDGCGLIWNDVDVHDAVLEAARHLVGRVRAENGGFCLRVGLHSGPFTFQKMKKEATRYWGVGLNDAWRAANLGDAGSLLITDTFYLTARDNGLPRLALEVHPPEEERGLEIFPTQGHGGRFRIYRGGGTYEAIPSRVEMRLAVREKLRDDLIQIAFEFGKRLELHAKVPIGELKPRVTVWLPDLFVPGHLSATTHRYRILGDESAGEFDVEVAESKSGTIYSTVEPGEGPPGMAWANGGATAVVANGLPDFEENPEKYVRLLEAFGLGRGKVETLGCKSQMIAACAFPMKSNKAGLPVGVLCLDTEHPLGNVPRDELERLAADLVSEWATILTLALNFRI